MNLNYFCLTVAGTEGLTVANELEIAKDNNDFIAKYGRSLNDLFQRMKPYISYQASKDALEILGESH